MTAVYAQEDRVAEFSNAFFEQIIDPIIALLAFVAIFLLIYVVFRFMRSDSSDRSGSFKGLAMVVLGITVIFSVWTIFSFVRNLATTDDTTSERIFDYEDKPVDFLVP
ncbi:MAG: hypothetical protein OYG31_00735 [Candidatus Kaiserbacteria bacterium]|nr:hypothetical protein [Candidatus Kaiserbacteria bacterium]